VCRYNLHSAGSLGWPFPMLKYKYIFSDKKYTEAILSNSSRTMSWFEISKMLIAHLKKINLLGNYCNFRHTFVPYRKRLQILSREEQLRRAPTDENVRSTLEHCAAKMTNSTIRGVICSCSCAAIKL